MSTDIQVSTLPKAKSDFSQVDNPIKQPKKKSPRVTLRFTEEEHSKLTHAAIGTSLSAYIRCKLFAEDVSLRKTRSRVPVIDQKILSQILGKLGQSEISDNLSQIAFEAQSGSLLLDDHTEQEIRQACAQIAWIRVKLIEALGLKAR